MGTKSLRPLRPEYGVYLAKVVCTNLSPDVSERRFKIVVEPTDETDAEAINMPQNVVGWVVFGLNTAAITDEGHEELLVGKPKRLSRTMQAADWFRLDARTTEYPTDPRFAEVFRLLHRHFVKEDSDWKMLTPR